MQGCIRKMFLIKIEKNFNIIPWYQLKTCSIVYQEDQKKQQDTTLEETCSSVSDAPKVKLSTKKLLKGHINKVNSVHYSGDSRSVLSIDLLIFIPRNQP